jgi:hypothetical protein
MRRVYVMTLPSFDRARCLSPRHAVRVDPDQRAPSDLVSGVPGRLKQPMRIALLASTLLLASTAACNDCDFTGRRCKDGAVEQCGGVDQVIGRTVSRTSCQGINPVCVEGGGDAVCAVSEARGCAVGATRCDGDHLLRCKAPGVEVALDCTKVDVVFLDGGSAPAGYVCGGPIGSFPADCRKPQ